MLYRKSDSDEKENGPHQDVGDPQDAVTTAQGALFGDYERLASLVDTEEKQRLALSKATSQ